MISSFTRVAGVLTLIVSSLSSTPSWSATSRQEPAHGSSLVGAWTLNRNLSDQPDAAAGRQSADGAGRRGARGGFGGGFGGRGGRNGSGGVRGQAGADDVTRFREAMRDITNAPDHVVIVDTGSMIVITAGDGRTLRLSPDGKKIKEANTGIERKTTWTGDKLVSEISGLAPDKITETYSVDPDSHRMRITVEVPGAGRNAPARTVTHIYDADAH